jgi:hypothetical protein
MMTRFSTTELLFRINTKIQYNNSLSNQLTSIVSIVSWRAFAATLWNRTSFLNLRAIFLIILRIDSLNTKKSIDFWYERISLNATITRSINIKIITIRQAILCVDIFEFISTCLAFRLSQQRFDSSDRSAFSYDDNFRFNDLDKCWFSIQNIVIKNRLSSDVLDASHLYQIKLINVVMKS